MADILTENEYSLKKRTALFSKLAFGFSILSLSIFIFFVANVTAIFRARTNNAALLGLLTISLLVSMTLGLAFSIVSLARKEKIKYIKAIAVIVNIGLVIVIIGSMIFSLIMDIRNMG